jgi:hypothetical protein
MRFNILPIEEALPFWPALGIGGSLADCEQPA